MGSAIISQGESRASERRLSVGTFPTVASYLATAILVEFGTTNRRSRFIHSYCLRQIFVPLSGGLARLLF